MSLDNKPNFKRDQRLTRVCYEKYIAIEVLLLNTTQ